MFPDWIKIKGYDKNFVQISIEQSFFLGETVQVEVMVNKRKVTRNIIDEKTGRVLEVETEVTTDDSDEDVVNPDGTIGKKPKRKMRRGKTGGQNLDGGDPGGRRRRRRTTTISGQFSIMNYHFFILFDIYIQFEKNSVLVHK